jgi:iron(III) transport system substrate-binding protein
MQRRQVLRSSGNETRMREMGMLRRKSFVALALALGLLTAACASGGESADSTADPGSAETTEASDSTAPSVDSTTDSGSTETTEAAGGAGSVADVLAEVEGLSVDERRARLTELAQEEDNELVLYGSAVAQTIDALAQAFMADTGVDVLTYRAASEDLVTRVLREGEAGQLDADVVWLGDAQLLSFEEAGLLAPFTSPYQENLVEGSVAEHWTVNSYQVYTVDWNTNLVAEGEQPQSYLDLADPKWDDQMVMTPGDADWYWMISNYLRDDEGLSEEELAEYWTAVTDGADFSDGHTTTRQFLISGEYAIYTSDFTQGVEVAKAEGAPIEWQPPLSPLVATPEAAAIFESTPRPATSVLFMDWMINEGQETIRNELLFDVTRNDLLAFDETVELRFIDPEEWAAVQDEMTEEFASYITGS